MGLHLTKALPLDGGYDIMTHLTSGMGSLSWNPPREDRRVQPRVNTLHASNPNCSDPEILDSPI